MSACSWLSCQVLTISKLNPAATSGRGPVIVQAAGDGHRDTAGDRQRQQDQAGLQGGQPAQRLQVERHQKLGAEQRPGTDIAQQAGVQEDAFAEQAQVEQWRFGDESSTSPKASSPPRR